MDLLSFVVLTILFRETIGGGFTISGGKTNWTTASKQCTFATPYLVFSSDKITVEIAESIEDEVWVGYYQAITAFEYFGCAVKDNDKPRFHTKADPGQCMSACGAKKIIGIFGNECFCFEKWGIIDNDQTMLPNCTKECKDLKGVVCGGPSKETDISSIGDRQKDKNCLYYDHLGFNSEACSTEYAFVCGTDSTVWIENNNNQPVFGQWTDATVKCFDNKTRPSTYNNTQSPQTRHSTQQLWTGIARSQVIYKYTTDTSHLEHANMYGYLNKNKELVLTDESDGKTRKSICVDGSPDVGAIVGATLSIVAVIVVVVVVVLILKKRGIQLPFLKKENQAPSTSMIQNNNAYGISRPVEILQSTYHTDQEEYAEIDLTTTIDNEARNFKLNGAPESSDYAHKYFVLEKPEEEQYDSRKAGDQKSDPNTYNPYNKLSFEKSSNYDHVGTVNAQVGNAGRKVSDSENTYNTTPLGNSYLMTSGGESNNAYRMGEETEDTYNHTNVPRHEMGLRTSENDYDAI